MGVSWQTEHLNAFLAATEDIEIEDPAVGKIPRQWAAATNVANELSDSAVSRKDLLAMAAKSEISTEAVCWSIFAWGGMQDSNRDHLIRMGNDRWLQVADDIRQGRLDRMSAYSAFSELRKGDAFKGVGPAYFTKLIFFLMPRDQPNPPGYIMDQWLACSINVLTGDDVVYLNATQTWKGRKAPRVSSDFYVNDLNDATIYDNFCGLIEELAEIAGKQPHETEWLLMSEGYGKGAWRQHVKDHRHVPTRRRADEIGSAEVG